MRFTSDSDSVTVTDPGSGRRTRTSDDGNKDTLHGNKDRCTISDAGTVFPRSFGDSQTKTGTQFQFQFLFTTGQVR
jgi:hypothetical protein